MSETGPTRPQGLVRTSGGRVQRHANDVAGRTTRLTDEYPDGDAGAPSERRYAQPEATARAEEIGRHVQRALEALSRTQREVFVLRHYEGFQLAEIAEALGCSIGSVKVHLFRAVRKLRQELKDIGRF